jgi:hypothetical protein
MARQALGCHQTPSWIGRKPPRRDVRGNHFGYELRRRSDIGQGRGRSSEHGDYRNQALLANVIAQIPDVDVLLSQFSDRRARPYPYDLLLNVAHMSATARDCRAKRRVRGAWNTAFELTQSASVAADIRDCVWRNQGHLRAGAKRPSKPPKPEWTGPGKRLAGQRRCCWPLLSLP